MHVEDEDVTCNERAIVTQTSQPQSARLEDDGYTKNDF